MTALIKAALVALVLSAMAYGFYRAEAHVEYKGYVRGADAQKAIDQKIFDAINKELGDAKETASRVYRELANKVLAEAARADAFKTDLEKARAINRNLTNDTARQLAGVRLRFAAESSAASAACGPGGGGTGSSQAAPASNAGPAACELSAKAAGTLREIVFDADTLRDDYRLLYEWANRNE